MSSTETELAWAAGLFEGEGCLSFAGVAPTLKLVMTDEPIVRKFHEVIGDGNICMLGRPHLRWKQQWAWHKSGRAVEEIAGRLWRYLGERRRAQFMEMFRSYDLYLADQQLRRTKVCEQCGQTFLAGYNKPHARRCRRCWGLEG